jgi:hypothetical protein
MATKTNTKATPPKKRFGADKKDLISEDLPDAALKRIEAALKVLEDELAFIPLISQEDQESLAKPGAKIIEASYGIVDLVEAYPQYIHNDICDPAKLRQDLAFEHSMAQINARLNNIHGRVASGMALAQSDIQRQSSGAYTMSRVIPDEVGVNAHVEPMKKALSRTGRPKKPTT